MHPKDICMYNVHMTRAMYAVSCVCLFSQGGVHKPWLKRAEYEDDNLDIRYPVQQRVSRGISLLNGPTGSLVLIA